MGTKLWVFALTASKKFVGEIQLHKFFYVLLYLDPLFDSSSLG